MRKGIEAYEKAAEESAKGGGGYSGRLGYFNLEADASIGIRFLTDLKSDVLTLDFWEFISDVEGKPQNFAVAADVYDDPKHVDWVTELGGMQRDYQTKELVDPYPKTKSVGLAVVCKEVAKENSSGRSKLSWVPEEIEIDTKKGKFVGFKFIIVKQAYKNFWQPLKTHYDENGGTICDRVFKVKRVGGGIDTTYNFLEKDVDPAFEEDYDSAYAALQECFGYGDTDSDPEDPDRFKKVPMTLDEWAEDSCSEKRVRWFLDEDYREKQKAQQEAKKNESSNGSSSKAADEDADEANVAPPPNGSLQSKYARHVKADA